MFPYDLDKVVDIMNLGIISLMMTPILNIWWHDIHCGCIFFFPKFIYLQTC